MPAGIGDPPRRSHGSQPWSVSISSLGHALRALRRAGRFQTAGPSSPALRGGESGSLRSTFASAGPRFGLSFRQGRSFARSLGWLWLTPDGAKSCIPAAAGIWFIGSLLISLASSSGIPPLDPSSRSCASHGRCATTCSEDRQTVKWCVLDQVGCPSDAVAIILKPPHNT